MDSVHDTDGCCCAQSRRPDPVAAPASATVGVYKGDRLNLNFQSIELRTALQQIADVAGLNLIASDDVQGSITLRLKDVPWDQALDLVLQAKGLDKRVKAGVLLVAPAEELAARELLTLESRKQMAELAPLRRELLQVNYAKAADLAKLFQSVTGLEGVTDERGSVAVDDRTNNIIAYQTGERLEELRRIVAQLDIPVRQVMIEARIVEANVDYDKVWAHAGVGDSIAVTGARAAFPNLNLKALNRRKTRPVRPLSTWVR